MLITNVIFVYYFVFHHRKWNQIKIFIYIEFCNCYNHDSNSNFFLCVQRFINYIKHLINKNCFIRKYNIYSIFLKINFFFSILILIRNFDWFSIDFYVFKSLMSMFSSLKNNYFRVLSFFIHVLFYTNNSYMSNLFLIHWTLNIMIVTMNSYKTCNQ